MTDHDTLELEGLSGLSRRDVLVKGGLLAAGASLIGAPAAAAAARRAAASPWSYAVITHGAGDLFWVVVHNGANAAGKALGVKVTYNESFNDPQKPAQLNDTAVAR